MSDDAQQGIPEEAVGISVRPGERLEMSPDSVVRVVAKNRAIGIDLRRRAEP